MASGQATPMNFSAVPSGQTTPQGQALALAVIGAPDGRSPNGKRPRPREENQGGPARSPMTTAELTTAVMEMQPMLQITSEAVRWNCDLLNALIGRVNSIEAWTKIAEPEIAAAKAATIDESIKAKVTEMEKWIQESSPKMEELTGFGDQVKEALRQLEVVGNKADGRLREEITAITDIVEKAIAKVNRRIDGVAQDGPAARPSTGTHADADVVSATFKDVYGNIQEIRMTAAALGTRAGNAEANAAALGTRAGNIETEVRRQSESISQLADRVQRAASGSVPEPWFGQTFGGGGQGAAHGGGGQGASQRTPQAGMP